MVVPVGVVEAVGEVGGDGEVVQQVDAVALGIGKG